MDHDDRGEPVAELPDGWVRLTIENQSAYFNTRDLSSVRPARPSTRALVETAGGSVAKVDESVAQVVSAVHAAIERVPRRIISRHRAEQLGITEQPED